MTHSQPQASREAQALAEIAATRLSTAGGWTLVLAFLATVAVGSLLEGARFARGEPTAFAGGAPIPSPRALAAIWRSDGALAAHRELRAGLLALEDRLGRESALSAALRPAAQSLLARVLEYGNSQVVVGRSGWLYFRTEFDYLTGRGFLTRRELARRRAPGARYPAVEPDPVAGLAQLHRELAARGIELVFFPVPVKAQVHPGPLARGGGSFDEPGGAPANPSYPELVARLSAAGIPLYDALPDLTAAARRGEQLYFTTDTHWNGRGIRVAAAGLARFLAGRSSLPSHRPEGFRRRPFTYEFKGDMNRLLGDGLAGAVFPRETAELDEIVDRADAPVKTIVDPEAAPVPDSDVLLLGDSYSLVFSAVAGGRYGSFGEQLAFALDRPVRRMAKVGDNNLADRVRWLRDDPQLLAGKRVLVYEVTARALVASDWSGARLATRHPKRRKP